MTTNLKFGILAIGLGLSLSSYGATEVTAPTVGNPVVAMTELETPQIPSTMGLDAAKEIAKEAVKEAEIPVVLESPKKASANSSLLFKVLSSLAVIAILGIGAFLLIGRYRRTQIGKSTAPEIKILRQHYLGPKKSLAIIRVAGESILIGMTDHNINMIKSLSLLDEDVPDETPQNFQTVFQKSEMQTEAQAHTGTSKLDEQEDFSISGIRDFVSTRLKNMRSLD